MILLIIEIFSVQHTVFLERTSLVAQTVKRLSTMRETQVQPWVGKIPWRRKWQSTPILLPGKSHGQRSLVGYSPWGRKKLDTTERHGYRAILVEKTNERKRKLFCLVIRLLIYPCIRYFLLQIYIIFI